MQKLGLTFNTSGYVILGLSIFLAILVALAMAMILGVLAEDFRSAQNMIMPLMFMVMIPYFISLFADINTVSLPLKIFILAIPFSHPFLVSQNLYLGNYGMIAGGLAYMLVVFVVLVIFAARVFSTRQDPDHEAALRQEETGRRLKPLNDRVRTDGSGPRSRSAVGARTVSNTAYRMVYPFLPVFARAFGVDLATMSLALSARSASGALGPLIAPLHRPPRPAVRPLARTGPLRGRRLRRLRRARLRRLRRRALFLMTVGKYVIDPAVLAHLSDLVPYARRGRTLALTELSWSLAFILGVPAAGFLDRPLRLALALPGSGRFGPGRTRPRPDVRPGPGAAPGARARPGKRPRPRAPDIAQRYKAVFRLAGRPGRDRRHPGRGPCRTSWSISSSASGSRTRSGSSWPPSAPRRPPSASPNSAARDWSRPRSTASAR